MPPAQAIVLLFSLQELVTELKRTWVYNRLSAIPTSSPILILPQLISPKEEVSLAAMCRACMGTSSVLKIKVQLVPSWKRKQKIVWPFSFTSKVLYLKTEEAIYSRRNGSVTVPVFLLFLQEHFSLITVSACHSKASAWESLRHCPFLRQQGSWNMLP